MPTESNENAWSWFVFAVVLATVIAKNASLGVFVQAEEMLLLSADERGQTTPVEIGWPLRVLVTEAYTFDFYWSVVGNPMPIGRRAAYIAVDAAVAALLTITATRYLSRCLSCCDCRFNLRAFLACVAVLATLIVHDTRLFSWRGGVGAFAFAMFRCVDAVILFGVATAWYWLLTAMGATITRLARSKNHPT